MTQKNTRRREPTPYIRFCSIVRPVLREYYSNLTLAEMGLFFGTLWSSIPEHNRNHVVNTLTTEMFRNFFHQHLIQRGYLNINEVINNKRSDKQ